MDEEGPAAAINESTDLTVAVIYVTRLMALIARRSENDLGFILIFNFFICLVRGTIQENVVEVGLAVVATNDQDFIVASV